MKTSGKTSNKPTVYSFKTMDQTAIKKGIASIISRGKALRKIAHETAVGSLMHYEKHGDYTLLIPLADAIAAGMSKSLRAAFIEWVVMNSSLQWDEKDKKFFHPKKTKAEFNAEEGKRVPFFELERETKPVIFDGSALVKYIKSLQTKAENEKNKIDTKLLRKLEDFAIDNGLVKPE